MDLSSFFQFLIEQDKSKRIRHIKELIEFFIVLIFTSKLYELFFGKYDLIDITSFGEISDFIFSSRFILCLSLLIVSLIGVRFINEVVMYSINEFFYRLGKWIFKQIKNPKELLSYILVDEKDNKTHLNSSFYIIYGVVKYLHVETKKDYESRIQNSIRLYILLLIIYYWLVRGLFIHNPFLKEVMCINFSIDAIVTISLGLIILLEIITYTLQKTIYRKGNRILIFLEDLKKTSEVPNETQSLFHPDRSISSDGENGIRGRVNFSRTLRKSIISYNSKECLVIGLTGSWGDGKTSLINMTFNHTDFTKETKYVYFEFNPWGIVNQEHLLTNYLTELKKFLYKCLSSESIGKISEIIDLYINGITGTTLEETEFTEYVDDNISVLKQEINNQLEILDKKIIVLIDDLDRLEIEEVMVVFKLVKSVGDFKNFIYVLPFDKSKLGKQYTIFLKKIVQVEISLPPIDRVEILTELTKRIKEIFDKRELTGWNDNRVTQLFYTGLKYYITNLRSLNRITNSFLFYVDFINKKDLDHLDLLSIVVLQNNDSLLYKRIYENKSILLKLDTSGNIYTKSMGLDVVNKIKPKQITENSDWIQFIGELFPQCNFYTGNFISTPDQITSWRTKGQITSEYHFEEFFLFQSDNHISTSTIKDLLSILSNYDKYIELLNKINSDGKIIYYLDRLNDFKDLVMRSPYKVELIKGFLSIYENINDPDAFLTSHNLIINLVMNVVGSGDDMNKDVLLKLVDDETISISILIEIFQRYFSLYSMTISNSDFRGTLPNGQVGLVMLEFMERLKIRINNSLDDILNRKDVITILYWGSLFNNDSSIQDKIRQKIQDKEYLFRILRDSKQTNLFHSYGSGSRRYRYDIMYFDQIFNLPDLIKKMRDLIPEIGSEGQSEINQDNTENMLNFIEDHRRYIRI